MTKRKATITLQQSGETEDHPVAVLAYKPDTNRNGVWVIREDVRLPTGGTLAIESAFVEATGNLSLAIHQSTTQPLLATCRWGEVDPYFGVGLPDVGVLHVYLQRGA